MKYFFNLITLLIYVVTMIFCFIVYGKQQNTNLELNNKVKRLEYKLQQAEERYERTTDACLDILANKRWN